MAEGTATNDYIKETGAAWLEAIKREIIYPQRAKALAHPFVTELQAGTLPKSKIRKFLSDQLWNIMDAPRLVAALASRCRKFDHETRSALLINAHGEISHPEMLARAVNGLGGDAEVILNGPAEAYDPEIAMFARNQYQNLMVFTRPWIEGIAAFGVGVEAPTPAVFSVIGRALKEHFGLSENEIEWFRVHGGEVEQDHGNEGISILERSILPNDLETQSRCRYAIEKMGRMFVEEILPTYYGYEGP